jgi:hypothetical protein
MSEQTVWESVKIESGQLLDRVRHIIREGNVRRIRVRQNGSVVAEFPLTVGVVGTVFAPVLAAIGALAALLTECSIEIERVVPSQTADTKEAEAVGEP